MAQPSTPADLAARLARRARAAGDLTANVVAFPLDPRAAEFEERLAWRVSRRLLDDMAMIRREALRQIDAGNLATGLAALEALAAMPYPEGASARTHAALVWIKHEHMIRILEAGILAQAMREIRNRERRADDPA